MNPGNHVTSSVAASATLAIGTEANTAMGGAAVINLFRNFRLFIVKLKRLMVDIYGMITAEGRHDKCARCGMIIPEHATAPRVDIQYYIIGETVKREGSFRLCPSESCQHPVGLATNILVESYSFRVGDQ
jgi:hypothetical protein